MCWDRETLQCFQIKNIFIQRLPRHAQSFHLHVTTPALSVYLSRLPWFSPWQARKFKKTHSVSEMGSSLNASKDIGMGGTDFALTCGPEPVMDAVCTAVVRSARTGRVLDAGSDREDRSSHVCHVGDTRWSFSQK